MSTGIPVEVIANLAKGQDRGNMVTVQVSTFHFIQLPQFRVYRKLELFTRFRIQETKSQEKSTWILQDSCTNAYESMVIYAPVEIAAMQSVMTGCDSSNVAILASGFSILSDGLETRPTVISTRPEEKSMDGGSLLTTAIQILANTSPTAKLSVESVDTVNTLISCTLQKIRTSLKCEDG